MIEQPTQKRPGFACVAGFEKRGRLYAAIEYVRLFGPTERDLPNVLQGNPGIGRKSNGGLLRIGPALAEIVARSQEGSPITRRRSPYAVAASAVVEGHSVNTVSVEIRTAYLPTAALRIRAKDECSFGRSQQQKKVSLPDLSVSHTVQDGSPGCARISAGTSRSDSSRLDGFQSCLNFTCALITLYRFLGKAALNNGPKAGGTGGPSGFGISRMIAELISKPVRPPNGRRPEAAS